VKKLKLNKDTIRNLQDTDLAGISGAEWVPAPPTPPSPPSTSMSCTACGPCGGIFNPGGPVINPPPFTPIGGGGGG
jgi:hypothetical protein